MFGKALPTDSISIDGGAHLLTLTYGFKKPQTGDKGSVFYPAMETNMQQLNDHTHNGSDSARLPSTSLTVVTQSILSASWVDLTNGNYRQAVTMPAGFNFDEVTVTFRLTSGHYINPTVEKISTTSYYVYCNDNSVALTAVYGL
jgi:hypothetical protein